jgi:hypothetical protein
MNDLNYGRLERDLDDAQRDAFAASELHLRRFRTLKAEFEHVMRERDEARRERDEALEQKNLAFNAIRSAWSLLDHAMKEEA